MQMRTPIASLDTSIELKLLDGYGDGTVWARIEDGQRRGTTVCIDGRKGSPTRYRLFENARHPRATGATLIELGSREEGLVVSLISQWLESDDSLDVELTPFGIEMVQEALLHLGEPPGRLGEYCLEIVIPRFLDTQIRHSVECCLGEALRAAGVGRITGGGGGNGKTDFFVVLTDLEDGIPVIRSVMSNFEFTKGAIINQYEPVVCVHRLP